MPPALPLQNQVPRGIYETPYYSLDRQSILLAAIDSEGCLVAWERARDAAEYAHAMMILRDALNHADPVPLSVVAPSP